MFRAGEARRVWVNAADDPASCSFTLMSVVRRGDLVVTIGTGGRSPALAAYLKERLAADLGPEWETLLEILSEARDLLGGNGILLEHHVVRHWADIEAIHTFEGTETMQTLIVGRDITGFSAFA